MREPGASPKGSCLEEEPTPTCLVLLSWWLLALKHGVTIDLCPEFVGRNRHLAVA